MAQVKPISTGIIDSMELSEFGPDVYGSIFAVGNGSACTRGTGSHEGLGAYRGHYISGLYTTAGYGIIFLMQAPDWLPARLRVNGQIVWPVKVHRTLDMRTGLLRTEMELQAGSVRANVVEERFMSMSWTALYGQRYSVTILDGNEDIEVEIGIDGDVRNHRAKYYRVGEFPNVDAHGVKLSGVKRVHAERENLLVEVYSPQTSRGAAVAAMVRQTSGAALNSTSLAGPTSSMRVFRIRSGAKGPFTFEKVCLTTCDIGGQAVSRIDELTPALECIDYENALHGSVVSWEQFWRIADVQIGGDPRAERAIRYALFSTRIAAPVNDGLSSIGAKNLSGDWYLGGVFWDAEMFQLPMLSAIDPAAGENVIRYRARRLPGSKRLATQDGYAGARYPFATYDFSDEWPCHIHSTHQLHVNLAIAWSILHHHAFTGDCSLLLERGALDVLVNICRFWASRANRDERGEYHWLHLNGPDELHRDNNDNSYTNVLASKILTSTADLIGSRDDLRARVEQNELSLWREIAAKVHVARIPGTQLMAQFEGFDAFPEPDEKLTKQKGEGADRTHKQADTLLLFQALPGHLTKEQILEHYSYYAPLCHHTSSLSLCTHAIIAAFLGRERDTMRFLENALGIDLEDSYANTAHGIHGAGEGGVWLSIIHGFGGLMVDGVSVSVDPLLPSDWNELRYSIMLKGQLFRVLVGPASFTVTNEGDREVTLACSGEDVSIAPGRVASFPVRRVWLPQAVEGVVFDTGVLWRMQDPLKTLNALRSAGLKIGIVELTKEEMAQRSKSYPAAITRVDESILSALPPDPQAYYVAAQRMRCIQWNCIAVVGSDQHCASAREAGMVTVSLGNGSLEAFAVIDSEAELVSSTLASIFARSRPVVDPYYGRNLAKVRAEAAERE